MEMKSDGGSTVRRKAQSNLLSVTGLLLTPTWVMLILLGGCRESELEKLTDAPETISTSSNSTATPSPVSISAIADVGVDFSKIIGTSQKTWLPLAIANLGLESDMTPQAVGERVPGSQQVSNLGDSDEFVVSEVAVGEVPGLEKYKFTFHKDAESGQHELTSVTLVFEPALKAKLSYAELAQILALKYGELEPEKLERQEAFWFGPGFTAANLIDRGTDLDGYELEVMMPD